MKRFRLAPLGLGIAIGVLISAAGLLAVAVAPKIFSVEAASATTGTGFTGTILARGSLGQDFTFGLPRPVTVKRVVRVKTKSGFVKKTVRIRVDSIDRAITCTKALPCDTAFQQGTLQPGGTTGWHTHPGPTFVAFAQGDGTVYHVEGSGCTAMKVGAGTGFTQMPTERHVLHNDGSVPIIVYTLYVLPNGTPSSAIRVDQPQPTECPNIH